MVAGRVETSLAPLFAVTGHHQILLHAFFTDNVVFIESSFKMETKLLREIQRSEGIIFSVYFQATKLVLADSPFSIKTICKKV